MSSKQMGQHRQTTTDGILSESLRSNKWRTWRHIKAGGAGSH